MSVVDKMNAFIAQYGAAAHNAAAGTTIFPQTILSAAALESGYGESNLSKKYNNFFGIKAGPEWTGKFVTLQTKEQDPNGKVSVINARFRFYNSPEESFRNYVKFISGPRYVRAGVLNATSPVDQFAKIKAAGYATDVKYVSKLTEIFSSVKTWLIENPGITNSLPFIGFALLAAGFFF